MPKRSHIARGLRALTAVAMTFAMGCGLGSNRGVRASQENENRSQNSSELEISVRDFSRTISALEDAFAIKPPSAAHTDWEAARLALTFNLAQKPGETMNPSMLSALVKLSEEICHAALRTPTTSGVQAGIDFSAFSQERAERFYLQIVRVLQGKDPSTDDVKDVGRAAVEVYDSVSDPTARRESGYRSACVAAIVSARFMGI